MIQVQSELYISVLKVKLVLNPLSVRSGFLFEHLMHLLIDERILLQLYCLFQSYSYSNIQINITFIPVLRLL